MERHEAGSAGRRPALHNRPDPPRAPRVPDLRPASPGQLALIGLGLGLAGMFLPGLGILSAAGIVALVVAGVSYFFFRPRTREMYWRGRRIDVPGEPTVGERLYRALYRRG